VAFFLVIVKAIIEVAALALLGQFLVGVFAWGRREGNVVYRLFQIVASPFTWVARKVSPRIVLDQHIPLVAFLLLAFAWVFVVFQLRASCIADPRQQACPPLQQVR
jgi:hypothetical protein